MGINLLAVNIDTINIAAMLIAAIAAWATAAYLTQGARALARRRRVRKAQDLLANIMDGALNAGSGRGRRRLPARRWIGVLDAYVTLSDSLRPDDAERSRVARWLADAGADLAMIGELSRKTPDRRARGAHYLGYVETEAARRALTFRLASERCERVRLRIVHALARQEVAAALPEIIDSLKGSSGEYIARATGLLLSFPSSFTAYFPELERRREKEIVSLILEFARIAPYRVFADYLAAIFGDPSVDLTARRESFARLAESYPEALDPVDYLGDPDPSIRRSAIEALGSRADERAARALLSHARSGSDREIAVRALSRAVSSAPVFLFLDGLDRLGADPATREILSEVFESRFEYFLPRLAEPGGARYETVIARLVMSGRVGALIAFLNANHDRAIENRLVSILSRALADQTAPIEEFRIHLKDTVLQKLGLSRRPLPVARVDKKRESIPRAPLAALAAFSLAPYPALVLAAFARGAAPLDAAVTALNRYLVLFGLYSLAVNIFLGLLFFVGLRRAAILARAYAAKSREFLFQKNVLPAISIIAPAFREEKSIVASVESLLTVNYPDFEVIVVNDGSDDLTLSRLVSRFSLERRDADYPELLRTQPVRGVYANPRVPALLVVDKINGGKADSLNAGINAARNEYVLGIDSDSLIEGDSLLKLASAFLDEDRPVSASGGNILPANGCAVDRGAVLERRVPRSPLPLLQTAEYLRSFMNGRVGWSALGSLMIISGAFGVFRRREVIEAAGYLTSRGRYEKDTVGEDMELVVRLARQARERGERPLITYCPDARCWTEVPSDLASLKRQRDRWQRGLVDILFFHRRMAFNPRYGAPGVLGFPYYLFVETVGPWLEAVALLLLAVGVALRVVAPGVLSLVLVSNALLGFTLTAGSLYMSDRSGPLFPLRDRLLLLAWSILETLGFRQLVSLFRVTGMVGAMRGATGWGAQKRRGFGESKGRIG
jgi:cellulose synthase/poly-beta-1,6-N-acetylglucosamine synthase-like glycosyltransferase/HEAT repeat protein